MIESAAHRFVALLTHATGGGCRCYNTISSGLEKWQQEVALVQLGMEGQLSKSSQQLSDAALKRIIEAGGEGGKAAGASYRKHSASMQTNEYLARGCVACLIAWGA